MKHLTLWIVFVVLFALLALPVSAQETFVTSTPEALTPTVEAVIVASEPTPIPVIDLTQLANREQMLINVIYVLLLALAIVSPAGMVLLFLSAPPWLVKVIYAGGKQGVALLKDEAILTETKIDDVLAAELEKHFEALFQKYFEKTQNASGLSVKEADGALYSPPGNIGQVG